MATKPSTTNDSDTLTRASIADAVYQEIGLSHAESAKLVDDVLEEIIAAIVAQGTVKIAGFGSFEKRRKPPRMGRNPKTKKPAKITERNVVSFYASNLLKKRINEQLTGN